MKLTDLVLPGIIVAAALLLGKGGASSVVGGGAGGGDSTSPAITKETYTKDYGYGIGTAEIDGETVAVSLGSHGEVILGDLMYPPGPQGPPSPTGMCVGDNRGMIDLRAPVGSTYHITGPWGDFTDGAFVPMTNGGQSCIYVDGCWGGGFTVYVKTPDGRVTPYPVNIGTFVPEANACYGRVDAI